VALLEDAKNVEEVSIKKLFEVVEAFVCFEKANYKYIARLAGEIVKDTFEEYCQKKAHFNSNIN